MDMDIWKPFAKFLENKEKRRIFAALPISAAAATHTAETSKAMPSIFHNHESSKNHIITAASSYFCS